MTWKTLRLFFNTLTADNKYSLLRRDNLMQPNQMHLSEKKKNFFLIFLSIFQIYFKLCKLPYLLMTLKVIELERVSVNDMENLMTVC